MKNKTLIFYTLALLLLALPLMSASGGYWKPAGDIQPGDWLLNSESEWVQVKAVRHVKLENPVKVYNLEVDGYHTYFVGKSGVLVHNKPIGLGDDALEAGTKFMSASKVDDALGTLGKGLTSTQKSSLRKVLLKVDADLGEEVVKNIEKYGSTNGLKPYLDLFKGADENGQRAFALLLQDMYGDAQKVDSLLSRYGTTYIKNHLGVPTGAVDGDILLRGSQYSKDMVVQNYPYLSSSGLDEAREDFANFIFDHGMVKQGKSTDIVAHMEGFTHDTVFHSATADFFSAHGAAVRANNEGFIFVIRPKSSSKIINGKDIIRQNLNKLNGFQGEFEMTIKGDVLTDEIVGAIKVKSDKIVGYYPNPHFTW